MLIDVKPRGKVGRKSATNASIRASVQALVDGEMGNLRQWIQQTANGIPKLDADGNILRDPEGSVIYVLKPDPSGAVKLVSELAEYAIPKLSRQDIQLGGVVAHLDVENVTAADLAQMSLSDLKQLAMSQFSQRGDTIDVQAEVVPSWLDPLSSAG